MRVVAPARRTVVVQARQGRPRLPCTPTPSSRSRSRSVTSRPRRSGPSPRRYPWTKLGPKDWYKKRWTSGIIGVSLITRSVADDYHSSSQIAWIGPGSPVLLAGQL